MLAETLRAKPVCYIRGTIIYPQTPSGSIRGRILEDCQSLPTDAQTVYPRAMTTLSV
jgi:hypothetical protein